MQAGVLGLMLLTDSPHYDPLLDSEEQAVLSSRSWLAIPFLSPSPVCDHITTMSISEPGSRLAVLHQSGCMSVWLVPSLVLESSTRLEEQLIHDKYNPQLEILDIVFDKQMNPGYYTALAESSLHVKSQWLIMR